MSLTGTWRILEMDLWDREDIDLIGPGFIEFSKDRAGHLQDPVVAVALLKSANEAPSTGPVD